MINLPFRVNEHYEIRAGQSIKDEWPTEVYHVHNLQTGVMELEVTSLFEAIQYPTYIVPAVRQLLNSDSEDESPKEEEGLIKFRQ